MPSTQGVLLPLGTPDAVVDAWEAAWRTALAEPAVRERLQGIGFVIQSGSAAAFERNLAESALRFAEVIAAAGIQGDDG
ncbi:MAG: Tripartite-type tricarboxylate transporter, receptor component TctC [Belnapia sp.]|nr:Tripartite-type tricarboxylate transporter, receptor component TctC [Belnapia sp.]